MDNPVAPIANMALIADMAPIADVAVGGAYVTLDVKDWMDRHPDRADEALARDQKMREFVKLEPYRLYEQGSKTVIEKRMAMPPGRAPAEGHKIPGSRKKHCATCDTDVNDWSRHNREHHTNHPGQLWICPVVYCRVKGCGAIECGGKDCGVEECGEDNRWTSFRDGTTVIDEHMVKAHWDFRNWKGYAGALGWRMCSSGCAKHHNKESARAIGTMNQTAIPVCLARKEKALLDLQARLVPDYDVLVACLAALPVSVIHAPAADLYSAKYKKADLCGYLVEIRCHLALWEDAIKMAESYIANIDDYNQYLFELQMQNQAYTYGHA